MQFNRLWRRFNPPTAIAPLAVFLLFTTPSIAAEPAETTQWYSIRELEVEGKGWTDTKEFFDRLPAKAEGVVRGAVWGLSRHSAGMCARFVSDAPSLQARWTLTGANLAMAHMAATGVSGLDLYVKTPEGRWRWLACGQPKQTPTNTVTLAGNLPSGSREYCLYLPLYNGVREVEIGVPKGSRVARAAPRPESQRRPIVFYGTSITHGACASRPGMCHPAIVGRRLERPVINLGFSGNGKMEPEMAALLAELDPAVYVLDCLPNMQAAEVAERVEPFVRTLRAARPSTPILLVEDRFYADGFLVASRQTRNTENHAALKAAYQRLVSSGVPGLHYLAAERLLGADGEDTVDGSHPTDLGFWRHAEAFEQVLAPVLGR